MLTHPLISYYPRHPLEPGAVHHFVLPGSLTPGYAVNSSASFSVTTDQPVSSAWYLDGINQSRSAQVWTHTWGASEIGKHIVTYAGTNGNGSVSITWDVSVDTSFSLYDVNQDGIINEADLEVIRTNFGIATYAPYPRQNTILMKRKNIINKKRNNRHQRKAFKFRNCCIYFI